jgi:peroxiredoxin
MQFDRWRWTSGVLAIVTALVLAATWSVPPATPVSASGPANLNFTVQDMNGQTVRLADFRGRPVILNFWATWCGPCRAEIPEFNTLAEQYKAQGLVVLGVSVDDKPEALRKFTQEFPMKYPVLVGLGHDELQEAYDAVIAVPVTWFIRADGTVQHAQKGPATREFFEAQAKALVQSASGGRP